MARIREDLLSGKRTSEPIKLPSERQLMARYGVSRPTLSKALTALAAEGLIVKEQGRGNFLVPRPCEDPAQPERVLPRLGFVAPITGAALVQRVFRGIDREAHRRGYQVIMSSAGSSVARERNTVRALVESGVAGLVVYPVPRMGVEIEEDYLQRDVLGLPLVLVGTCVPEQGHAQIVFDHRLSGYRMTEWLLERGHRRIAIMAYSERLRHPATLRFEGYREALARSGLAVEPALCRRYEPSAESAAISGTLRDWLAMTQPPTAIIAAEDIAAMEVIEQLLHRGVRVPEDICVAGFDDQEAARAFRPQFTTTRPDFVKMGELAAEAAIEAIRTGQRLEGIRVLDVPLLERTAEGSRNRATRASAYYAY